MYNIIVNLINIHIPNAYVNAVSWRQHKLGIRGIREVIQHDQIRFKLASASRIVRVSPNDSAVQRLQEVELVPRVHHQDPIDPHRARTPAVPLGHFVCACRIHHSLHLG